MREFFVQFERALLGVLRRVAGWDRFAKLATIVGFDLAVCVAAVWIAFSLRLGEWILASRAVAVVMTVSIALWLTIFFLRGLYRSILRYVGLRTMAEIALACILMGASSSIIYTLISFPGVPRTIGVIHAMVFCTLIIMGRLVGAYLLLDVLNQRQMASAPKRVIVYGAGSAGRQLLLSLRHEPGMVLQAFIDDNPRLTGKRLEGIPIFGGDDVTAVIETLRPDFVVLAMPGVRRRQRETIVRKFENVAVHVLTLPAITDLVDGTVSFADLREIELGDLLGREPVPPHEGLLASTIAGRTVMVTGAGGSIGSELCRQIARLAPARLVLVEMTEHALYQIEEELREEQKLGNLPPELEIFTELGNVADKGTAHRLFDRWEPETVLHAAAYKHVPLVEANVIAGIRNNIFGTLYCAREAEKVGVRNFVLVSTDKAVRPTNVMGATKRACELVLQALAAKGASTKFAMVRFGNVLGSSGSVVPRFQRQIRSGGPVTLTHRDVTRYFMVIPEAAQLVIQAGAMSDGGEVYVLDMGEPVRIYDLARTMINLSGLTVQDADNPHADIEIRETGLRKGEKLYEELLIGNAPQPTAHTRIMKAHEAFLEWDHLERVLEQLDAALDRGDRHEALKILSFLVPEFDGEQSVR